MATDNETKKNSPNDWSFVAEEIQSNNEDSSGNYRADTMFCFLKHGTLALTFHSNSNGGIVCSKCFQFMKLGSFALHATSVTINRRLQPRSYKSGRTPTRCGQT